MINLNMRKLLISLLFLPALMAAENIDVTNLYMIGPYPTPKPFMTDTLDAEGKKIDLDEVYLESLTPILSEREGKIAAQAMSQSALDSCPAEQRDILRADILRHIIALLMI